MSTEEMEKVVVQICYRAADLAFLLDQHGEELSKYSEDLRAEPDDFTDVILFEPEDDHPTGSS
jgi:hypothetical protein